MSSKQGEHVSEGSRDDTVHIQVEIVERRHEAVHGNVLVDQRVSFGQPSEKLGDSCGQRNSGWSGWTCAGMCVWTLGKQLTHVVRPPQLF